MNAQLTNVVETAILGRIREKESFTALDISNALKADRYPFRHREVAEAVREVYASGAMDAFAYRRQLIPVTTPDGTTTETYLYYHQSARTSEYTDRDQVALPPVPADQARDLTDCVSAAPLGILPRPARRSRTRSGQQTLRSMRCGRRDGAFSIPRRVVEQLGWTEGSLLNLKAEPGRLTIGPCVTDANKAVRVWGGKRVRVCKLKLRLGALCASVSALEVVGDSLQIAAKPTTIEDEITDEKGDCSEN